MNLLWSTKNQALECERQKITTKDITRISHHWWHSSEHWCTENFKTPTTTILLLVISSYNSFDILHSIAWFFNGAPDYFDFDLVFICRKDLPTLKIENSSSMNFRRYVRTLLQVIDMIYYMVLTLNVKNCLNN